MTSNKTYLLFAKELAKKAGDIMLRYFDTDMRVREKEDEQVVTVADEEINRMVIEEVGREHPDHSVFGEEASIDKNSEYIWVCDPIDGTIPFINGVPISVFSLALVKDGEPIVGVVNDPFMKRLYSAVKGQGSYVNDKPIRVSRAGLGGHSIVNVEWWPEADFDIGMMLSQFSRDTSTYVPNLSSIAHASCLVASGKYVATLFAGGKGKNVDIAAAKIIVEEAGGKVTDLFGNEQRYDKDIRDALISNGVVHDAILKYLRTSMKNVKS